MKKITLLLLFITGAMFSQSNVTNVLNQDCGATLCTTFTLGCCPTDGTAHPDQNLDLCVYKEYYVDENVILNYETFILSNCTLEFRNGANFVDNGLNVVLSTSEGCEANIIFTGGGNRYSSVEEMNAATLSLPEIPLLINVPSNLKYFVYNVNGQLLFDGLTTENFKNKLPKQQQIILKIEGYKSQKVIIK